MLHTRLGISFARSLAIGVCSLGTFALSSFAADVATAPKPVTFTKDIAPIFQEKCEACHRKGLDGADVIDHLRRGAALGKIDPAARRHAADAALAHR